MYLPTQELWHASSPDWARNLWPILRVELEVWCKANHAQFFIDTSSRAYAWTTSI